MTPADILAAATADRFYIGWIWACIFCLFLYKLPSLCRMLTGRRH